MRELRIENALRDIRDCLRECSGLLGRDNLSAEDIRIINVWIKREIASADSVLEYPHQNNKITHVVQSSRTGADIWPHGA